MTVIRPNSISGVTSITAQGGVLNFYRADGTVGDLTINNIVGAAATFTGVLTYEDVANVDSVGVVTARTDINLGDSIIHIGDTNTKIRFPAADTITAETGGSERLRIDSSGRLLLGTTTEGRDTFADNLTVADSGNCGITIRSGSSNDGNIYFSDGTSGAAEYQGIVQYNHANNELRFYTSGVQCSKFNSSGHVEPGTDSTFDLGTSSNRFRNIYADNLYGNGSNLTGLSGLSVANQANNRLITATGTTDSLNAEVDLTWDGSSFKATGSGGVTLRAGSTNAGGAAIYLDGDDDGDWSGATYAHITHDTSGNLNVMARNPGGNSMLIFGTNDYNAFRVDENRHIRPESDNARDLGTSSYRWRNLYTTDLQLSNKGSQNDVDGTWGNYTIQEGESDLFLINNRSGKKYKFNLTEVS